MMNIRVTYLGRRYDAATELPEVLNLPLASKLTDALAHLKATLDTAGLGADSCLVSLNGEHVGGLADGTKAMLQEGDEILLVNPVAGG